MKLYRIVPDTFSIFNFNNFSVLQDSNYYSLEDVWYELGLVSFTKINEANSAYNINKNSFKYKNTPYHKFFYIFPKDAITYCKDIIEYKKCATNFRMLTFDFPIEKIYKYFGFGKYHDYYGTVKCLEFCLPLEVFNGTEAKEITGDSKILQSKLIERFSYMTKVFENLSITTNDKYIHQFNDYYQKYLKTDNAANILLNSDLYKSIKSKSFKLIKTPYTCNHIIDIFANDIKNLKKRAISIEDIFQNEDTHQNWEDHVLESMGFKFNDDGSLLNIIDDKFYEENKTKIIKTLKKIEKSNY